MHRLFIPLAAFSALGFTAWVDRLLRWRHASHLHGRGKLTSSQPSPAGMVRAMESRLAVFLGDSRAAAWPTPAARGWRFRNLGISGESSAQTLARLPTDLAPLQADLVILQTGINDLWSGLHPPARFPTVLTACQTNLAAAVAAIRSTSAALLLVTVFPPGPLPLVLRLAGWERLLPAVIQVNGFLSTLIGPGIHLLDSAAVLADSSGFTRAAYSQDSLHLNAHGYAALNQSLVPLLESLPPAPHTPIS